LNIDILFYTRKDYNGIYKYLWLPITFAQGKYVHCEILVNNKILIASNRYGVIWDNNKSLRASNSFKIGVDENLFYFHIQKIMGQPYSWSTFFKILWPRWGDDPKGMICSELVAYILANCAMDMKYKIPFIAVPPHRWTPNQIFEAINRLREMI
jgi:hypothetical protein